METKVEKNLFLKYAMNYGVILGSFWVFKYLFLIISTLDNIYPLLVHFIYGYSILSIVTLVLYYVLLTRYRDQALGGKISYLQCISFSVVLFLFASLFEAVLVYIHYNFIDPTYVLTMDKSWLEALLQMYVSKEWLRDLVTSYGHTFYMVSDIIKNTLLGFVLSLIYGAFIKRVDTN